jgi:hypothetical protein
MRSSPTLSFRPTSPPLHTEQGLLRPNVPASAYGARSAYGAAGCRFARLERFAIRAFPMLLYFPPASEAIYKYSGKRELEALTTYAKGGWKETDAFDPS